MAKAQPTIPAFHLRFFGGGFEVAHQVRWDIAKKAGSVSTHMQGVVEWGAGGYIYRRRLKEREGKM
ncbi:MAG: hypothetical protein OXH16_15575 [Gemmatimonadetes bacterium]|nr:hypothetical protein [Gemmatimonadota bacterium]